MLHILAFFAPALISVLLYERFRGYELPIKKRVILFCVFVILINIAAYCLLRLGGWTYAIYNWVRMTNLSFIFSYTASSLISSVVFAFTLSFLWVRVINRKT